MKRHFALLIPLLLLGCNDEPDSSSLAKNTGNNHVMKGSQTQGPNYLCDDLVKSLGVKDAYSVCMEQAHSGNIHAQATVGALYANGQINGVIDWHKANEWLMLAAKQGHPQAQYLIARSYELGRGIDRDQKLALEWLNAAAQAQYPLAQAKLGVRYLYGDGVVKDTALAYQWLSKSSEKNDPQGMYYLALMLLDGIEVVKDPQGAEKLLLNCAQNNDVSAMLKLGDMHRLGLSGPQNEQKANYWYTQALEQHDTQAQYHIASLILNDKSNLAHPPFELLTAAAKAGHSKAQLTLARQYHLGEKIDRNEALALQWYIMAAEQNEPEALYQLGLAYVYGYFKLPIDQKKAAIYLKSAEKLGYYPAKSALEGFVKTGDLIVDDKTKSLEYLHKAAQSGAVDAQVKLAKLLTEYSLPAHDKAAFYWANKAAENNDGEAKLLLGRFYFEGIGTPIDYKKSYAILLPFAEQNNPIAQLNIAKMYYYGYGLEKNHTLARKWLLGAISAGSIKAKEWAPILFQEGYQEDDGVDNQEWLNYAAENGDPAALYHKALNHLYGKPGYRQDNTMGMELLQLSGQKNYTLALRELGNIYMQGLFGHEDLSKALGWYMAGAKQGDDYSQYRLAHMYYYGIGTSRSYVQSYVWANMAAQKGHSDAIQLKEELNERLSKDEIALAMNLLKQEQQ